MRQTQRNISLIALGICGALGAATEVRAAGFEHPDNGTISLGRGGAYAAGVDEPSALYYNPAALTRLKRHKLTLNLNLTDQKMVFERAPFTFLEGGLARKERTWEFDPVENEARLFPAPMYFEGSNLGMENFGFAVGLYGPSSHGARKFPDTIGSTGPTNASPTAVSKAGQQYMIIDQSVLLVYPSVAAAYRIDPAKLSLGLTLQAPMLSVDYNLAADGDGSQGASQGGTPYVCGDPLISEDTACFQSEEKWDLIAPNRLQTFGYNFTFIAGALWEPTPNLSLGASVRPEFKLHTKGEVEVEFPDGLSGIGLYMTDQAATLDTVMPTVVRLAAEYKKMDADALPGDRPAWSVEGDYVWEGWSAMDAFRVKLAGSISDVACLVPNPDPTKPPTRVDANVSALSVTCPEGSQSSAIIGTRKLPNLDLYRNFEDAWSARVGFEKRIAKSATSETRLRTGGFYEKGATPKEWTNLDFISLNRIGLTVGGSYILPWGSIDAAYAYMYSPTWTVTNGKYEALLPLEICAVPVTDERSADYFVNGTNIPVSVACDERSKSVSHPVNNGTYDIGLQVLSLGTTLTF